MGMAQLRILSNTLTGREIEVLELMAEDMAAMQISAILEISVRTVEQHRGSALRKLGCRTHAGAIVKALRAGTIRL